MLSYLFTSILLLAFRRSSYFTLIHYIFTVIISDRKAIKKIDTNLFQYLLT